MREASGKLFSKAASVIEAAEDLLKKDHTEVAVGRAYYAMFYVAEALLAENGLSFKTHGGVHGAFGQYFAKTGILDRKFHKWLIDAFDKRITTDYGVEVHVGYEDAKLVIDQAKEFLRTAQIYLGK